MKSVTQNVNELPHRHVSGNQESITKEQRKRYNGDAKLIISISIKIGNTSLSYTQLILKNIPTFPYYHIKPSAPMPRNTWLIRLAMLRWFPIRSEILEKDNHFSQNRFHHAFQIQVFIYPNLWLL